MTKLAYLKSEISGLNTAETLKLISFLNEQLGSSAILTEDTFWTIIELLNKENEISKTEILQPAVNTLCLFSEENIQNFANIQARLLHQLDTKAHAEASMKKTEDNVSADGFLYARCAVIAAGKDFYYQVLETPSEFPAGVFFESLLQLPFLAYEKKTGKQWDFIPDFNFESFFNQAGWGNEAVIL